MIEAVSVINLPPHSWLITPGIDIILKAQYWLLLLTDGHSAVVIARSALVSGSLLCWAQAWRPPVIMVATFPWSYWAIMGVARERGWPVSTEWVKSSTWLLKILLCWGHPLVSIHMAHKYLHVFPHDFQSHTKHCFWSRNLLWESHFLCG